MTTETNAPMSVLYERPTISVPQAGEILGIGRNAAYEAAKSGQLPVIKMGRLVRVPSAPLRRLLGLD